MKIVQQTIQLPDGNTALNLLPNFKGQAALVALPVLKRLAELLPKANVWEIRQVFVNQLSNANIANIGEYLKILEDELAFHHTVNVLTTIDLSTEIESAPQVAALTV